MHRFSEVKFGKKDVIKPDTHLPLNDLLHLSPRGSTCAKVTPLTKGNLSDVESRALTYLYPQKRAVSRQGSDYEQKLRWFKQNCLEMRSKSTLKHPWGSKLNPEKTYKKDDPKLQKMEDGKILYTPKQYRYFSVPKFLETRRTERKNYIDFYHYDGSAESRFLATQGGFHENGTLYEQMLNDVGIWNITKKKFHRIRTQKRPALI